MLNTLTVFGSPPPRFLAPADTKAEVKMENEQISGYNFVAAFTLVEKYKIMVLY